MKLAIVHEWLVQRAGSDRVFETLADMFPDATLFATVFRRENFNGLRRVRTSPLQRLPRSLDAYRYYLPLMPFAVRSHNLKSFDVILSSSHFAAKGVRVRRGQLHLCYCYTPPRYLWDLRSEYFGLWAGPLVALLQAWDRRAARTVHHFAAISTTVQERIRRIYGRESDLVFPPCDTERLPLVAEKSDYYVTVSRLVRYKRVDLIVRALEGRRLVVVGDGPEMGALRNLAGPTVRFTGWIDETEKNNLIARARAFVFAADEDFGIAPVEALACGTPVIAYRKGGVLDTVQDGVFYDEPSIASLADAVKRFESMPRFDAAALRRQAERFSTRRFRESFMAWFRERAGI